MRRSLPLALIAALAMSTSAFTTTDVGGDRVYFECTGSGPYNNPELAVGTWSEEAPSGAMGSGSGGCFSLDSSIDGADPGNPVYDVVFEGAYDGAIRDLAIHMYVGSTLAGHQSAAADLDMELTVIVDGAVVYQTDPDGIGYFVMSHAGSGPFPGTTLVEGTLEGLGVKPGKHTVQITMTTPYVNVPTFFMYGASDADGGLSFNPKDTAGFANKA